MNFYLGVTDQKWFDFLSQRNQDDINFWQPGGGSTFKRLEFGEPFLFKLKAPRNKIGGVGFFVKHTVLPINVAWDTFQDGNGSSTFNEFYNSIVRLRTRINAIDANPLIGCIVLSSPVFFKPNDWIDLPLDWSSSIVQGKTYNSNEEIGKQLWKEIELTLAKYQIAGTLSENEMQNISDYELPRYGNPVLTKPRLGQGAFRVLVTDAYSRKCSISGEKTLPVLEAAHIKPYSEKGPHATSNGLLLRSDIHKLFDNGYITITKELKVEVSGKIREEFENGREYYKYHGNSLLYVPSNLSDKPKNEFIEWHNSKFRG